MHEQNISHDDLHHDNPTITQTADGETFAVKMIVFDRMTQHAENTKSLQIRKDLFCIVTGLYRPVEKGQCRSSNTCVQGKCANEVQALLHLLDKLEYTVECLSSTCRSFLNENVKRVQASLALCR